MFFTMSNHSAKMEKKKSPRHGHRPRNDSFNTEQSSHTDGPATSGDATAGDREAEIQRKRQ